MKIYFWNGDHVDSMQIPNVYFNTVAEAYDYRDNAKRQELEEARERVARLERELEEQYGF